MKKISIIIPALNEEKNILFVIDNALLALKEFGISGEIIVINDGSVDNTSFLVEKKIKEFPDIIKMIFHKKPEGIGASFWDGVDTARGEVVVMLPGDNENDPREILRYFCLMEHVDIVVPFIFNKEVRPFIRRLLSSWYNFIIRISFLVNFNYTNGTILCRRSVLKELEHRSKGFFITTDILIRTAKKGYLFAEVPSRLDARKSGKSNALSLSTFWRIFKEYLNLFLDIYFREKPQKNQIIKESITYQRKFLKNN
jgi:glycosyltransferase involved in cell wall biosynthesis